MCVRYELNRRVAEAFAASRRNLEAARAPALPELAALPRGAFPETAFPEEAFPGDAGLILLPHDDRGREAGDDRSLLTLAVWGLTPAWAKEGFGRKSAYNARAETLLERPTFREPFRKRRCLIPASAFYERAEGRWLRLAPPEGEAIAFAGLFEPPNEASGGRTTYTIVTTSPNETIAAFHDRMPVVLDPADHDAWLDPARTAESVRALLVPTRPEALRIEDAGPIARPKRDAAPTLFE